MTTPLVRYRNIVHDSARWEGFEFRDGDIIISTPPKCGTTWTQTICALLVFQETEFYDHVDQISPWLDQSLKSKEDVFSTLGSQTHRRFIKTHTPLDGLPMDARVTYLCVGRDPRDVIVSWDHHMQNLDMMEFINQRAEAVGLDDLAELMADGSPVMKESPEERFWDAINDEGATDGMIGGLAGTLHHYGTFFAHENDPNVVLLHYGEMKDDLEGQMRMIAGRLGIDVSEDIWPSLVEAATFETMKSHAADRAPNATKPIWVSTDDFFHKGTNGQWHDMIKTEDELARYTARVEALTTPEISAWAHRGPITL